MTKDLQAFSCLVIADESEEFPDALIYAGLLCRYTGWRLLMLRRLSKSQRTHRRGKSRKASNAS